MFKILIASILLIPLLASAKPNDVLFAEQLEAIADNCAAMETLKEIETCEDINLKMALNTEFRVQLAFNRLRPYCQLNGTDPDGDGWGWENQQSCIVKKSKVDKGFHQVKKHVRVLKRKGAKLVISLDLGEKHLFNYHMRGIIYNCHKNLRSNSSKVLCIEIALELAMLSETRVFSALNGGKPYCKNTKSAPGGWGWENGETCVVIGSPADKVDNYNTDREFDIEDLIEMCSERSHRRALSCYSEGVNDIIMKDTEILKKKAELAKQK